MLILLGIANGFTAGVRQRMMKCAALLGSYDEAVQMLADEGIKTCVNTLRKVTAGMGEMLARLTKMGTVKVSGDATGRRIVVTTDGGRVRLREKRRGRTKKGHKRFKPAWRNRWGHSFTGVEDASFCELRLKPLAISVSHALTKR